MRRSRARRRWRRPAARAWLVGLALLLSGQAEALSMLALDPPYQEVTAGQPFHLVLTMDFDTPTLGGGVEVRYDPRLLSFERFRFDAGLGDDPLFRLAPADGASLGSLVIGFGSIDGLSGDRTVGELVFVAEPDLGPFLPPHLYPLTVDLAPNDAPAGPFLGLDGASLDVVHGSATVFATVPEPQVLELLVGAGFALGLARRRGSL